MSNNVDFGLPEIGEGFHAAVKELWILDQIEEPTFKTTYEVLSVSANGEELYSSEAKATLQLEGEYSVGITYDIALWAPEFHKDDRLVTVLSANHEPLEYIKIDATWKEVERWYVDNGVLEIQYFTDTDEEKQE